MAPPAVAAQYGRAFREKLQQLECPYTERVTSDDYVLDLLTKPGEHRTRLLEWLLARFDSRASAMLDSSVPIATGAKPLDTRLHRLLTVASALCLCGVDDIDIIKGSAPLRKQLPFLALLIDVTLVRDECEQGPVPGQSVDSLTERHRKSTVLIDSVAHHRHFGRMFDASVEHLLPPDMYLVVAQSWQQRGGSASHPPPPPDPETLDARVAALQDTLAAHREWLQRGDASERDRDSEANFRQRLQLSLGELTQVADSLRILAENELRPWTKSIHAATPTGELGPTWRRVHALLEPFAELLGNLNDLRRLYAPTMEATRQNADAQKLLAEFAAEQTKIRDSLAALRKAAGDDNAL